MKRSKISRLAALLLAMIMIICLGGCGSAETIVTTTAGGDETTTGSQSSETTEEETTVEIPTDKITFFLFGCDTVGYTAVDQGRSDVIKIIQIDPAAKTVKSIGILRDTKAPIEGYDDQKINGAYQIGGASFAMETISKDFGIEDLGIQDYIMINFSGMVQLIDYVDGVNVEITEEEAAAINQQDGDYVGDGRPTYSTPVEAGLTRLDGSQALAFCRTRKIDSDYFRSARQNKVMKALIEKLKSMPVTTYPDIIEQFFALTETSLTLESVNLWTLMDIGSYEFSSYIVPDEVFETDVVGGIDETGSWVWQYDLTAAGERIRSILDGTFESDEINEYGEHGDVADGIEKCGTPLEDIN